MACQRSRRIVEEQSSLALVRDGKREPLVFGEEAIVGLRTEPPQWKPSITRLAF